MFKSKGETVDYQEINIDDGVLVKLTDRGGEILKDKTMAGIRVNYGY